MFFEAPGPFDDVPTWPIFFIASKMGLRLVARGVSSSHEKSQDRRRGKEHLWSFTTPRRAHPSR